ncbi:unnamed protein product [Cochlearia groenlandica]
MAPTVIRILRESLAKLKKRLLSTKVRRAHLIHRVGHRKVNPRYGEAYGVGSAKTQFYQPYVPYPSWTQEDLRADFEEFKGTFSKRLERLEASSSAGPDQVPQEPHDPSQGPQNPNLVSRDPNQLDDFNPN